MRPEWLISQGYFCLHCFIYFYITVVDIIIYSSFFVVETASIRNSGLFKPNPYLQVTVDDKLSRKTEVIKNTLHPKWNENFTILVTPLSQLLFRLADHHSFRKDNILGEKKLNLLKILQIFNGKCENVELTIGKFCSQILFQLMTNIFES